MFQQEMTEKKTGQVNIIQNIQPDKQLLHYIYSGRLFVPLTETTAQPLFVAVDKYNIFSDLKEECVDFLLTCILVARTTWLILRLGNIFMLFASWKKKLLRSPP